MLRLSIQTRQAFSRITLPVLFLLSFGFILLGKVDTMVADSARISVADALAPLYRLLSGPTAEIRAAVAVVSELWTIRAENDRLRTDLARLRQWQAVALALQTENERLKANLHWVPAPAPFFVTAPVVADAGGVYARAALVSLGVNQFVHKGMVALDDRGVVGRVTDVGARSARILLITDLNSRIPVVLEHSRSHAILAGTNGPCPRLLYWTNAPPAEGEHVVTSGEGEALPAGLPLGTVRYSAAHVPELVPDAALDQLALVRIFDFDLSEPDRDRAERNRQSSGLEQGIGTSGSRFGNERLLVLPVPPEPPPHRR